MRTFTFGGRRDFGPTASHDVQDACRLLDTCVDHGVNMFDTATMYSTGLPEEILGEVLDERDDDILVPSKARMPIGDGPNHQGVSRWHLIRECERSLKRLRIDHVDLYHMHDWDGPTPVEEKLAAAPSFASRFVSQQIHYTLEARHG
jgi:aryl-alcohol dehydrogenase-like predicted oxidoreductase